MEVFSLCFYFRDILALNSAQTIAAAAITELLIIVNIQSREELLLTI